jgi:hypothetical protein
MLIISSVVVGGLALVASPAAAAGDVTVTVTDSTGTAVEGADVSLRNAGDGSEAANGTTDANGSVTFSSQADGDYYAQISDPGYVDVTSSNVTVSAGPASVDVEVYAANQQLNRTVNITNDTTAAFGEATANGSLSTAGNSTDIEVEVVGIDANGNETILSTESATVSEGTTERVRYPLSDSELSNYSSVEITVSGNGSYLDATEAGTEESYVGGGGGSSGGLSGLLSASIMGIPALVILLAVVGILALAYRSEQ